MAKRLSTYSSGVAGEYFVAAELSRRGFIASLTQKTLRASTSSPPTSLARERSRSRSSPFRILTKNGFWTRRRKFRRPPISFTFLFASTVPREIRRTILWNPAPWQAIVGKTTGFGCQDEKRMERLERTFRCACFTTGTVPLKAHGIDLGSGNHESLRARDRLTDSVTRDPSPRRPLSACRS